jgi:hypothetical protein
MKTTLLFLFAMASLSAVAEPQIHRPATGSGSGGARVNQTTNIINDCERRTNDFKKTLDRALGKPGVRLGERENQLNRDASQLEDAMDRVGDSWNRDHNMDKTRGNVRVAIGYASDINRTIRQTSFYGDVGSQWAAVLTEINRLASTFGLPRVR